MNEHCILKVAAPLVAAFALFCSRSASADEILTFHLITDASSVQSLDVGDVEGHVLRLHRRSGMALFPDGSVGASSCSATSDYIKGAGAYLAYCNVNLGDHSVLWFKVTGFAKPEEATTVFPESPITVMRGTGRFEGVIGDGIFKGQLTPFSLGADLYGDVNINLRK